ncbi:unnamed protein product [Zymoseptoria tritici ST99CH_1E4]|uniref:Uncharacterized protein n=1 Tax=Zymoseptoria tritici ST99CH_1E4 TaxID=1276532 RepID=A0A2H1GQD1_ZYMTR|nr:unnamed protein product [Zymoseptoria tritici ST99CH_1E4]
MPHPTLLTLPSELLTAIATALLPSHISLREHRSAHWIGGIDAVAGLPALRSFFALQRTCHHLDFIVREVISHISKHHAIPLRLECHPRLPTQNPEEHGAIPVDKGFMDHFKTFEVIVPLSFIPRDARQRARLGRSVKRLVITATRNDSNGEWKFVGQEVQTIQALKVYDKHIIPLAMLEDAVVDIAVRWVGERIEDFKGVSWPLWYLDMDAEWRVVEAELGGEWEKVAVRALPVGGGGVYEVEGVDERRGWRGKGPA